jgi:hypothetical protein
MSGSAHVTGVAVKRGHHCEKLIFLHRKVNGRLAGSLALQEAVVVVVVAVVMVVMAMMVVMVYTKRNVVVETVVVVVHIQQQQHIEYSNCPTRTHRYHYSHHCLSTN